MKTTHITRDGKGMPIAAMKDDHLVNMLNLVYQKVMLIKNARSQGKPFEARLYGVQTITDENAADLINQALNEMAPYFIEAYLRDLPEPKEMLRAIFDRSKRLEGFDNVPVLTQRSYTAAELIKLATGIEEPDPDEGDR
jgi:hypothetical protein